MKTIVSYFIKQLYLVARIHLILMLLIAMTGCASLSKNFFEKTSILHTEITVVKCPRHLSLLKKALSNKNKLYCFVFTPEHKTTTQVSNEPNVLTGVWISSPRTNTHPLMFVPSGPTTTSFFQTKREMRLLENAFSSLDWQGDFIALTPRGNTQHLLTLKCVNTLHDLSNLKNMPHRRGFEYQNFFTSCIKELQTHATQNRFDPTLYNSQTLAHDILAFIKLVNYEKVNLLASSYGTRAALELIHAAPTHIERVLFENIYPLGYHLLDDLPWTIENILTRLEQACVRNIACKQKFNDTLTSHLNMALERLEKEPLIIGSLLTNTLQELATEDILNQGLGYYLDAHGYLNYIISQLYSKEGVTMLPLLLASGKEGRYFPKTDTDTLPKILADAEQNIQIHPLMKSVFYHLWLCNDRQTSAKDSFNLNALNSKLSHSRLPNAIKKIIKEEWEASPCKNFTAFQYKKHPVPKYTQTPLNHPLLVLSAEMNARFSPQLTPSPKFRNVSHIIFYGEAGQILLNNSCAQETAKYFFRAPIEHISKSALSRASEPIPCLNEVKEKTFPFKTNL